MDFAPAANSVKVPDLIIQRRFKASRERVFAALTEADSVGKWMCPPGFTVTEVRVDARNGGEYRIVMRYPEGDTSQWTHANASNETAAYGTFTEVLPPYRLAYTIRHPGDVSDEFVSADLVDHGGETELVFKHAGFASERSRQEYEYGWNGAFEQLVTLLSGNCDRASSIGSRP